MSDIEKLASDFQSAIAEKNVELTTQFIQHIELLAALVLSNGGQLIVYDRDQAAVQGQSNHVRFVKDAENRRTIIRLAE